MSILTIDYKKSASKKLFCQSLQETGFAVLHNHPISFNLIQETYAAWKEFFSQGETFKLNFLYEKSTQDGYFPFRSENAKGRKIADLKEFYHVYHWGKIPENLKEISLRMFDELSLLAAELLQWIESELPDGIASQLSMPLKNMIESSTQTLLRILHYPPLANEESGAERAAPHEDINLITLLPAATAPGLEVLDTKNHWHAVNCDPGNIVVNVGDMLQMCTQHYYKSTTHRVVNPQEKNQSRYSMPLFLHPRREVKLSGTHRAIDYLLERLKEIGAY